MKRRNFPLYKIFVYVALITLAISIIVPIAWVFLASLKSQLELVSGNPFDFPKQMLWSNFVDAFVIADHLRFGRIAKEVYMDDYRYQALKTG